MVTRQQFFRYGFTLLILAQTALSLIWAADNFGVVPEYADSAGYYELAKMLVVHRYRPFTFPLLLRLCMEVSNTYHVHLLFLAQTGLALVALWLLLGSLTPERRGLDKVLLFLAVGTNPLFTHFNFAVMAESLALSFAILAATALWNAVSRETWSRSWTLLFMVTFTLAINARGERIVSLSIGLMAGLLLLLVLRRLPRARLTRIALCFCLAFSCHLAADKLLHKSDQLFFVRNITLYQQAFFNVTFTRAERLWPLFPDEVRTLLPFEEMRKWDDQTGYAYTVLDRLQHLNQNVYRTMLLTVLRHDWPHLLYRLGAGVTHYTLSAIYPYWYFTGLPNNRPESEAWNGLTHFYRTQRWTYTRMAGYPLRVVEPYSGMNERLSRLTWWYWLTASLLVQTVMFSGIARLIKSFHNIKLNRMGGAYLFFTIAMLTTALIFAANPVYLHIRYTLTWHVFALTALFSLVLPVKAESSLGDEKRT